MPAITIFEGPDGGGKSTAAREYAKVTKALYYHFSAWRHMGHQYPRLYLEAMAPALMGYANVVLDRSWISDEPYNSVFHQASRLVSDEMASMLERAAMRCETNIVMCLPPKEVCEVNFSCRGRKEMLSNTQQLSEIYDRYKDFRSYQRSSLPTIEYDYTRDGRIEEFLHGIPFGLIKHSRKSMRTVGAFTAPYIIVGELMTEVDQYDTIQRWPSVSFNVQNNPWVSFTSILTAIGVDEIDLLWVDKSAVEETIERRVKSGFPIRDIIAFDLESGEAAIRGLKGVSEVERPNIHIKRHPSTLSSDELSSSFKDLCLYYNIF